MKTNKFWMITKELFIIFLLLNVAGFLFAQGTHLQSLALNILATIFTIFLIVRVLKLIFN